MIVAFLLAHQAQMVTFAHPVASASVVVEALGRAIDRKLAVFGSVNRDFVYVNFRSTPTDVALTKLADALGASWREERGTLILDRSPAQEAEEIRLQDRFLENELPKMFASDDFKVEGDYNLSAAIDLIQKAQATNSMTYSDYAHRQSLFEKGPAHRLLKKFVTGLGQKRIMAQTLNLSYSYSDQPTWGEHPIPSDLKPLVNKARSELETHRTALDQLGAGEQFIGMQGFGGRLIPERIVITVTRRLDRLTAMLLFYTGTHDRQVAWIYADVEQDSLDDLAGPEDTYVMSELGQEFARKMSTRETSSSAAPSEPFSAPLVQKFMNGSAFEVLGEVVTPALDRIAESQAASVVAVVPEAFLSMTGWNQDGKEQRLSKLLDLWEFSRTRAEREPGFIVLKPVFPRFVRNARFGRAAVSTFLKSYFAAGRVTVDALAEVAESCASSDGWLYASKFRNTLAICSASIPEALEMEVTRDTEALFVYSSLSPRVKADSKEGWVEFVPSQTTWERMKRMFETEPHGAGAHRDESLLRLGEGMIPPNEVDSRSFVHNGLPVGSKVRVRTMDTYVLRPESTGPSMLYSGDHIGDVARLYKNQVSGGQALPFDFSNLYMNPLIRVDIQVVLPNGRVVGYYVRVESRTFGQRPYSVDRLPEPAKTDFQAALKSLGGGQ